MAKIKVHELAKEVDRQSKEVIAFLQNKGIEVKAAQSSVEDSAAEMVRQEMKKKATPKGAEAVSEPAPAEKEKGIAGPKAGEGSKPAPRTEQVKGDQAKQEPVRKKKNIIFVSNPHNSKLPQRSGTSGNGNSHNNNNNNSGGGNRRGGHNRNNNTNNNMNRPLIRPLTPPSPAPAVGQIKPVNQQKRNPAKAQQENRGQQENRRQQDGGRPQQDVRRQETAASRTGGVTRTQGTENRQDRRGQERTGGNHDYRSRQTDNRPGGNRFGKDGGSFQGGANRGRNFHDSNRPEKGTGREDNKFRKPVGAKAFAPETSAKEGEKHRDDEKRRMNQERDKRSRKDAIYEDGNGKNRNKPGRFIKPEKKAEEKQEEKIKTITLPDSLTVKELADKMKIQPSVIVKKLFLQGQVVTVNQEISFETAEEIAIEYEIICEREVKVDVIEELLREEDEDEKAMVKRPPVICVMGHVDHGKTSLLDAIRKTNVTDREAGGITQHIGAYTVNIKNEKITFLDTPGHEAFTAMRMRGANSTDIAILVVAADDGVMPQTVEAINHAKAAGIEIIVAVNKIDKPGANIDRVKQELTEHELIPVDWGGSTEFVPVSAKSGDGIETLLETILLTAEILELKANPERRARGLVIEAELDRGRGPVATVLVQKGMLHVGDFISAGASHGKVRAMIDDKGRRVKEAGPSTPVEILGLSDVPGAGEIFIAHENDKTAKSYAETYLAQNKEKKLEETKSKMSLDDLFTQIQAGNLKELNLIVKADVQGSVEAVKQSLLKLSNEEVVVKCIHGGVGAINESDVTLASASNAIIIGFNIRPDATAKAIAEREGVDIRLYKVIYQAIEDVEAAMKGMLDPVFEEKVIGHAEVRQLFRASAVGNIAGSYVLDGIFQRGCKIRITREGTQIFEGALASLKRFKDDVKEVKAGFECGLVFEGFDQMQELDIVEAYIMVEVPR
jgi:translation initiation factor IF-2